MNIQRNYVHLNRRLFSDGAEHGAIQHVHYREAGDGRPLVLLHPSPLSSGFMVPLMNQLASQVHCIAMDTPGYGDSDPLPEPAKNLSPYVAVLNAFIDALGLERPLIYGNATGAQIAIEFAKAYPQKVDGLLLENVAWFYADERDALMQSYFPELELQADGAHLQLAWEIASSMFEYFPWYAKNEDSRVGPGNVPAALVHETAMHYLRAGTDYAMAYRLAMENEDPRQMASLTVPTKILHWEGSLLRQYTGRMLEADLPECVSVSAVTGDQGARFTALKAALADLQS